MMTRTKTLKIFVTVSAVVLVGACTLVNWPYKQRDDTPVMSIVKPDGFKTASFGHEIVAIPKPEGAEEPEGMFLGVSAGEQSPSSIQRLSKADEISDGRSVRIYASSIQEDPWALYLTGGALASTPQWTHLDTSHPDLGCLLLGEPGYDGVDTVAGGFSKLCMETTDAENPRRVEASGMSTLDLSPPTAAGRSIAVIPEPGSADGALYYIVLGAEDSVHMLNNRIERAVAPSIELDVSEGAENFGVALATGQFGDDWPVWIAVGSHGRVYVYAVIDDPSTTGVRGSDPDHLWLTACYDSPGREGFGTLLWSGDSDDDGITDLIIGTDAEIVERAEEVIVVAGTTLEATLPAILPPDPYPTVTCQPVPEDVLLACSDYEPRSVTCGDFPLFGASVAVGDLDQDGSSEIVVGAPGVKVGAKGGAGAVYIFDPDFPAAPVSVLRDATPEGGAHIGQSVAVADIAGELEAVAGAPGSNEVFVFFCSGVGTDNTAESMEDRCR